VSESANAYRTVVVGATLVVARAYLPTEQDDRELEGRLLGSVPADATRRSDCDVLVVHTTG
jgi:nucleotide-binding universal stress UspA family protein